MVIFLFSPFLFIALGPICLALSLSPRVAAITAAAYSNLVLFPYESRMIEFLEMETCKTNRKKYAATVIQVRAQR